MRAKALLNDNGERVFAVIFETGDDPLTGLTRFAEQHKLGASAFTEVIVTESPAHLRRKHDPATGLALIDIPA